ncbi:hypothetical protein, partial [Methylorubrum extorquens]
MSNVTVIAHITEGEISPTYHVIGAGVRLFVVVSAGVEYSLIVGIENSLVGALARRVATPRALSGFSILSHHACRYRSAGSDEDGS